MQPKDTPVVKQMSAADERKFRNVPLTAEEVRALPVMRAPDSVDKKGNTVKGKPIACFVHNHPNNRQRRVHKQPLTRSNNRRNTNGRKHQYVDIMMKEEHPKFGYLNKPIGWTRHIVHRIVNTKIWQSLARNKPFIKTRENIHKEAA